MLHILKSFSILLNFLIVYQIFALKCSRITPTKATFCEPVYLSEQALSHNNQLYDSDNSGLEQVNLKSCIEEAISSGVPPVLRQIECRIR